MKTIAMATRHPLVHTGMKTIAEETGTYTICLNAYSTDQLLTQLENCTQLPDICILGAEPEGIDSITVLKKISTKWPSVKLLVLTATRNPLALMFSIQYGTQGFLNSDCSTQKLQVTIDEVLHGCLSFPNDILKELNVLQKNRKRITRVSIFTDRECTIMQLLCQQHLAKEIANKLQVSVNTIKTQIRRIYEKLNVKTKVALMACLRNAGLGLVARA